MHSLWGLQESKFRFELKGGTSLSKGFGIIHRFSEDIDIRIEPPDGLKVKVGRNQDKPAHVDSRRAYYEWLAKNISIPGIEAVERDTAFDDEKCAAPEFACTTPIALANKVASRMASCWNWALTTQLPTAPSRSRPGPTMQRLGSLLRVKKPTGSGLSRDLYARPDPETLITKSMGWSVVAGRQMFRQVHALMQQAKDVDGLAFCRLEHNKVSAFSAKSGHM